MDVVGPLSRGFVSELLSLSLGRIINVVFFLLPFFFFLVSPFFRTCSCEDPVDATRPSGGKCRSVQRLDEK